MIERARERDALLLAAGELRRAAARRSASMCDELEHVHRACARRSAFATPRIFSEKATLSSDVRCGNSA